MAKRLKQESYGSVISQLESRKTFYIFSSEDEYSNNYFEENIELYAKVIFSEHKSFVNALDNLPFSS